MSQFKLTLGLSIVTLMLLAGIVIAAFSQYKVVNIDMDTPLFPPFVDNVVAVGNFYPYPFPDELCIAINERSIVERGNSADQLSDHLEKMDDLRIDGVSVPRDDVTYLEAAELNFVSEQGKVVASYGGEFSFCYRVEQQLGMGWHSARFSVQSISGVEFSYSWKFEVISLFQAGI